MNSRRENSEFNSFEEILGDVIICDPLTEKGKMALRRINLSDVIDSKFFFDNLYVKPIYKDKNNDAFNTNVGVNFNHEYGISDKKFFRKRSEFSVFLKMMEDDEAESIPLIMMGTSGNGKSIEIQHSIYEFINIRKNQSLYFNFEQSSSEVEYYGSSYILSSNQTSNSRWIALVVVLNTFKNLINETIGKKLTEVVYEKFLDEFYSSGKYSKIENAFFEKLSDIGTRNNNSDYEELFNIIKLLIDNNDPKKSLTMILDLIMVFMYCLDSQKSYLIFDNLEHYILVNGNNVPIPNSVLRDIYNTVLLSVGNMRNKFGDLLFHKSFKIILVLRRTAIGLLMKPSLQMVATLPSITNDYTGYFNIWEIWSKKLEHIFQNKLVTNNNIEFKQVIKLACLTMNDNYIITKNTNNFQSYMAELMNGSIRRNGRAQAFIIIDIFFKLFRDKDKGCISLKAFEELNNNFYDARSYIYRSALMGIHFHRMLTSSDCNKRNTILHLGIIENIEKNTSENNNNGDKSPKEFYQGDITFVRRVLGFLSHFPEETQQYRVGSITQDIYATKSLYDLMNTLFKCPSNDEQYLNCDYKTLAEVLSGLGSISYKETKSGPFIILNLDNRSFDFDIPLESILEKIHKSSPEERLPGGKFDNYNYCLRMTNAGHMFLTDIMPSYTYLSSLFCSSEVPLFFLKDSNRIEVVIKTVYEKSQELCAKYEDEAYRAVNCTGNLKLGYYLPKINGCLQTYREQVKKKHVEYLSLFKDHINKNNIIIGISDLEKKSLEKYIKGYITSYNKWDVTKPCF
jgi:hypothetical protein